MVKNQSNIVILNSDKLGFSWITLVAVKCYCGNGCPISPSFLCSFFPSIVELVLILKIAEILLAGCKAIIDFSGQI
jgi:hypothetical protein